MSEVFQLVAQPTRRRILHLVWERELCAGDIAAQLSVTFGAVSQHLKLLVAHGLLRLRKDGRRHYYRAERQSLGALAPALEAMWIEQLSRLKQLAEAEESDNRPNS